MLNCLLWSLILLLLQAIPPSHAQGSYAATLQVTYEAVEMQRNNTTSWRFLPVDAITPIGEGDSLRTNRRGRAYITLFENSQMVVLPETMLTITTFSDDGEQIRLSVALTTGRIVLENADPNMVWEIITPHSTSRTSDGDFAVQATPESDYIVNHQATLTLETEIDTLTLEPETGIRISQSEIGDVVALNAPFNFGQLIGALDGCDAITNTNGQLLRVRGGPGDGFYYMGSLPNDFPLKLIAQAYGPGGIWYRAQYLSDFGWVFGALIETDCGESLPLLDAPRGEDAKGVIVWREVELPLLEPFFGTPDDDVWFYRRIQEEDD